MQTGTIVKILGLGLVGLGVPLLIMKIMVDSEPGAIPLLIILAGSAAFVLARRRGTPQDDEG